MKVNRNEPCPCGSGEKYKKCCLGKQNNQPGQDQMQDVMDAVREKMETGQFSSLEEAQAELNQFMLGKNTKPIAEFHGLSSDQMHHFLNSPFDSPELIHLADSIDSAQDVPALKLFSLLAEAIGAKGLKPTATGNLPQKFCRDAALSFWGSKKYERRTRHGGIRTEMDFFDMHCLRLVAELAGLVRKYKGKFILSVKCRQKVAANGIEAIYPDLFMAYVQKFNWAYCYGYQEIPFVQRAFMYTLFLLSKYGQQSRPQSFYEDIFMAAFPALLNEIEEKPYGSAEEIVRSTYFHCTLRHFADFLGLATLEAISEDDLLTSYKVKKLPLLNQFISFTL